MTFPWSWDLNEGWLAAPHLALSSCSQLPGAGEDSGVDGDWEETWGCQGQAHWSTQGGGCTD